MNDAVTEHMSASVIALLFYAFQDRKMFQFQKPSHMTAATEAK